MELYEPTRITMDDGHDRKKLLEKGGRRFQCTSKVTVAKNEIEFKAPYPRVPIFGKPIKIQTGFDVAGMNESWNLGKLQKKKLHIEADDSMGVGETYR